MKIILSFWPTFDRERSKIKVAKEFQRRNEVFTLSAMFGDIHRYFWGHMCQE